MTTLAPFAASLFTKTGRDIAARVAAMVERAGLPVEDALATAAEIGLTEGRAEGKAALDTALACMESAHKIRHPSWDGSATPSSAIGMARITIAKIQGGL